MIDVEMKVLETRVLKSINGGDRERLANRCKVTDHSNQFCALCHSRVTIVTDMLHISKYLGENILNVIITRQLYTCKQVYILS